MTAPYLLIGFATLLLFLVPLRYSWLSRRRKQELARAKLKKQQERYKQFLLQYASTIHSIDEQLDNNRAQYLSYSDATQHIAAIRIVLPIKKIPEDYPKDDNLHLAYQRIRFFLSKGLSSRMKRNLSFVKYSQEVLQPYFSNLLAHPLDVQQIDAILHDEDSSLVIAGAGCGKTTTIQGKVHYLIDQQLSSAKEILLLSYSKRSADDLQAKLGHLGVACRTFHSLAFQIAKSAAGHPTVASPEETEKMIKEISYQIVKNKHAGEMEAIVKLFSTFIALLKSNNKSFEEIYELNRKLFKQDQKLLTRNQHLLQLIDRVYQQYEEQLKQNGKQDFNDLIYEAVEHINKKRYRHTYRYILVDEFQDMSLNRYTMLQALKRQRHYKLFAVGDDWQSIYRFSGSDLTLFQQFNSYFDQAITKKIETTYRFANPMINVSSAFILKNATQTKKAIRSAARKQTAIVFDYNKVEHQKINKNILDIFQQLYSEYGSKLADKSIALIGRYHHDIGQIDNTLGFTINPDQSAVQLKTVIKTDGQHNSRATKELYLDTTIDFFTVHSAKGLERDIVMLINCETGKYGFPPEISDDNILDLLLSADDRYPHGEERRAFYVALTRAKEKFIFLADKSKLSPFVREIDEDMKRHYS